MRALPVKLHAYADYLLATLSILSPVLFGFGKGGIETLVPICFGLLLILYNFFTDYDLGLSKQIPITPHLRIDLVAGLIMATSPWSLRFHEISFLPHLIMGILLVINALFAGNEIHTLIQAVRERRWQEWFKFQ